MTRTAVKFGLFVALCLAFTLYLASTIGNTTIPGLVGRGEPTYTVQATFDDVTGLLIDDNVKVAGVPIGKVTGIDLARGEATVTMEIREDHPIPTDTTSAIRWRNLIGQRYIYLYPGDSPVAMQDGATITETTNVVDLGELFNRLGPIVATIDEGQVNEFLETVNAALEGNEDAVSQSLDDLAFVVQGLADRDQAIGRLIDNLEVVSRTVADRDAQIETMLDNLGALARTFSDNTALLETALIEMGAYNRDLSQLLTTNRAELDGIIAKLDNTLGTVEANLGPVGVALDRLDENASATFRTSRNGEFLNQTILCLSVLPPPCATPIIPGLDGILGSSDVDAVEVTDGSLAVGTRRGADALLGLLGGVTP